MAIMLRKPFQASAVKEKISNALYEYLPTLFAMDVAYWLKKAAINLQ